MPTALITGALGQDGSYLAEYLLSLGYQVHGMVRTGNRCITGNIVTGVRYHHGDVTDEVAVEKVIRRVHPREIYNLAGQTFVPSSWYHPAETFDVNVGGLARILKMVEIIDSGIRVYQASSSEMYGNILTGRQPMALDETVPMQPVSPYGVSKLAAHKLVDTYRQRDLYVVSGILFNHESERRGMEMVTRKIARHVAQWKVLEGQEPVTPLRLGNLKAKRDWGYAPEYVRVMHKMLQQERPDDYVVGTGEAHSVFDFLLAAVQAAGWRSLDELPIESNTKHFERQDEVHCLVADNTKARVILGWEPKVGFRELVEKMVHAEIGAVEHEAQIRNRAVGV